MLNAWRRTGSDFEDCACSRCGRPLLTRESTCDVCPSASRADYGASRPISRLRLGHTALEPLASTATAIRPALNRTLPPWILSGAATLGLCCCLFDLSRQEFSGAFQALGLSLLLFASGSRQSLSGI